MTATKKARESSARVKGFWEMRTADPKVDKYNHVKDVCVSDLLKTNYQALFAVETIQSLSAVAPSSAQLSELDKKNTDLTSKLSTEQIRYENRMFELRENTYESKEAYFRLKRKNIDISHCYNKFLAKFAYHEAAKRSKFEVAVAAYKLSEHVNVVDVNGTEEQATDETVAEEKGAEEGVADEIVADVVEQATGVVEAIADQMDAEEKWAWLHRISGIKPVEGSFTGNIFGGGRHSIVLKSYSFRDVKCIASYALRLADHVEVKLHLFRFLFNTVHLNAYIRDNDVPMNDCVSSIG
ncbi:unnamed protein product [Prunus armeniaca]